MVLFDFSIFGSSEHILVPLLFVFAVLFGSFQLIKIFPKAVNFIIALSLAIFSVSNSYFVEILWTQFGLYSILFIIFYFIVFLFKILSKVGGKDKQDEIVVFGAVLFVLLATSPFLTSQISFLKNQSDILLVVFIILMIFMFWAALRNDTPERAGARG
jgi:hypothetical protein